MPCLYKIYNKKCLVQHVLTEKSTQPEPALAPTQHTCPTPWARVWAGISSCYTAADSCSSAAFCGESPCPSAKGQTNCLCFPVKMRTIWELSWREHRKAEMWGCRGLAAFPRSWEACCSRLNSPSLRRK